MDDHETSATIRVLEHARYDENNADSLYNRRTASLIKPRAVSTEVKLFDGTVHVLSGMRTVNDVRVYASGILTTTFAEHTESPRAVAKDAAQGYGDGEEAIFAPNVLLLSNEEEGKGNVILMEHYDEPAPLSVTAIFQPNVTYTPETWEDALYAHAVANDVEGVKRMMRIIDTLIAEAKTEKGEVGENYDGRQEDATDDRSASKVLSSRNAKKLSLQRLMDITAITRVSVVDTLFLNMLYRYPLSPHATKCLLSSGANVDIIGSVYWNTTPLLYVIKNLERLSMNKNANAPLETVEVLLAAGADVNTRDSKGVTPLMECCWRGHVHLARLLIRYGASLCVKDRYNGWTPLHYASASGCYNIIRSLYHEGDDEASGMVVEKDIKGDSCISLALRFGHESTAMLLNSIYEGEDPDVDEAEITVTDQSCDPCHSDSKLTEKLGDFLDFIGCSACKRRTP